MDNFGVTASTGLAACNIQGQTVHRYLGIGFGRDPVDKLAAKVRKNVMLLRKWQQMRLLIIDEISMIDAGLFDKIEEVARIVRNNEAVWWDQIVACGISTSCRQSTRTARRGFVLKEKLAQSD